AIVQVVRCFNDPNIAHVSGKVNPAEDIETINLELIYADLATVEKRLEGLQRELNAGEKRQLKIAEAALLRLRQALNKGTLARLVSLNEEEEILLRDLHLLTQKPMLFVLNVDEKQLAERFHLPFLTEGEQLPLSVKVEAELIEVPAEEAMAYLETLGVKETGLDRLIRQSYALLGLITYFTSGSKETRAWTVRAGTRAPQAAGVIHTDFEKGFIRAEVISWKDFVEFGEAGSRERGLLRIEGKEYVMQDGDVCHFRFSA
ncbi:redox-regulated ATPase YchF, partial [Candidatus Uhrbacteria bacterium]|nr:redox-regulated ATPase YchF [Candidatus Uhrbacteria bacterium]